MGRYDDEYEYDYGIDDIEDIVDEYEDSEDYDDYDIIVDEDYNTQSDWENYYHNLADEIGDD